MLNTNSRSGSFGRSSSVCLCSDDGQSYRRYLRNHPIRELESSKWKLWHGRSSACLGRLARLTHWFDAVHVRDVKGPAAVQRHINDLMEYLYANELALVNYGRRRRDRLPISTAFVESAVNEILSKRMIKKQQMRWSKRGAHMMLQARAAVMNGNLREQLRYQPPIFKSRLDWLFKPTPPLLRAA